MNTRDLPIPPRAALPTTAIPALSLAGATLFPGTLLPVHAWEPATCRLLSDCLADRRLLVLSGTTLAATDRSHTIVGLGRAVSDRRYPDGRIDVFVHGLARVKITRIAEGRDGPLADLEPVPDGLEGDLGRSAQRLFQVARLFATTAPEEEALAMDSLLGSSQDPAVLSNRLAAGFIEPFPLRQQLLETTCPANRCALVTSYLAERLLSAAPAPEGDLH